MTYTRLSVCIRNGRIKLIIGEPMAEKAVIMCQKSVNFGHKYG